VEVFTREELRGHPALLAPLLLGALIGCGETVLRIVEVEAYGAHDDPASHAHRGRTVRNRAMFADVGCLYAYRSYGVHTCINVVIHDEGYPGAVLLRAGEPISGLAAMRARRERGRSRSNAVATVHLARGPGNLGKALGVSTAMDGCDLLDGSEGPWLARDSELASAYRTSSRIGISVGKELPWRFYLPGPSVSGPAGLRGL